MWNILPSSGALIECKQTSDVEQALQQRKPGVDIIDKLMLISWLKQEDKVVETVKILKMEI